VRYEAQVVADKKAAGLLVALVHAAEIFGLLFGG